MKHEIIMLAATLSVALAQASLKQEVIRQEGARKERPVRDTVTPGDAEYALALSGNIRALDTTGDASQLNVLASVFGAMYAVKKEWHPLYYQCLAMIRLSGVLTGADGRESALRQAEKLLSMLEGLSAASQGQSQAVPPGEMKAAPADEVLVLRADFAMAMLAFNRDLWQQYLPMINTSLSQAEAINPANPRPYYLQGIMTYHMPATMGGGKEAGMELFRKALEKYEAFSTKDPYAPAWGRKETEKYLTGGGK